MPEIGEGPLVGRLTVPGLTASQYALSVVNGALAGFLVVPSLLFSAGVDALKAVGTSLISVGTFGIMTAAYMPRGPVEPDLSVLYLVGGAIGGTSAPGWPLRSPRRTLRGVFAAVLIAVAACMAIRNIP